jgi:hypothetical protein
MRAFWNVWNGCGVLFGISGAVLNVSVGNYTWAAVSFICGAYCYFSIEDDK